MMMKITHKKIIVFLALIGSSLCDKLPGYGGEPPIGQYGSPLDQYGSNGFAGSASSPSASYANGGGAIDPVAALQETIPGIPGEDYPIYDQVPETAFTCDGQTEGGYYADPEAECQAFHICAADSAGGLAKYSFLCPNGTIFNQQYFICDWWFNFDCAEAEGLYSRNEEIAAEREAASGLLASGSAPNGYGAPANTGYGPPSSTGSNNGNDAPTSSNGNGYDAPQPSYRF